MSSMAAPPDSPPSPDLIQLAETTNTELEEAVNQATHQAFNIGCLLGLLPAMLFAIIFFFVSGFSLIGSLFTVVLGITGAIAFANLAAMITRRNTLARKYHDEVAPSLTRQLAQSGFTRPQFDQVARQTLSPSAPLSEFIHLPPNAGDETGASTEKETNE